MSDDDAKTRFVIDGIRQAGDPRTAETGSGKWTLLPPDNPNACSQCGVEHEPELPHDAHSLHYSYAFYAEHNRWPTWADAMAHCTPEIQEAWKIELRKHGIET